MHNEYSINFTAGLLLFNILAGSYMDEGYDFNTPKLAISIK